ncbi:MAG TPA: YoaK family protein [Ktedonobacteraceae bacterium]
MKTWKLGKLFLLPQALSPTSEGQGVTLADLARTPRTRSRIALFILLLTLNAGWTDMLAYLFLGHVFASFLTGNFLFIGLGLAQGTSGLLISALAAVLASLVGITVGTFFLKRGPQRRTARAWCITLVRILLMEWLLFLAFAIIWYVTSPLSQQARVQILLLCLLALGMGIQGALVQAFNFPGVVANALTGTMLTLGQRLAEAIEHPGLKSGKWRWRHLFRVMLLLTYVFSAFVVALTSTSLLVPVVPLIIVTIVIFSVPVFILR